MAWEAGTDGSGLQPLGCFNGPFPGVVAQDGIVRTFGAGEGENCEWMQMDAKGEGKMGDGNGLSADDADYRRWGEGDGGWAMADLPGGTSWPTGVDRFAAPGGTMPHFPTAPTAHNEKDQGSALGNSPKI